MLGKDNLQPAGGSLQHNGRYAVEQHLVLLLNRGEIPPDQGHEVAGIAVARIDRHEAQIRNPGGIRFLAGREGEKE